MPNDLESFHELSCYTLAHGDPAFIHQHAVDAFTAQSAQPGDKPIALAFALIGLHLHLDRGFDGRRVQLAHMALAGTGHDWPRFRFPSDRGGINARDVLAAAPGPARDARIDDWCRAAWHAWRDEHGSVDQLLRNCRVPLP